jgi:hypothetical protein
MKKLTKIQWINIIVYSFFALYFIIPWKMIFLQDKERTDFERPPSCIGIVKRFGLDTWEFGFGPVRRVVYK